MTKLTPKELELLKECAPSDTPTPIMVRYSDQRRYETLQMLYNEGLIDGSRFTMVNDRFFFCVGATEKGIKILSENN